MPGEAVSKRAGKEDAGWEVLQKVPQLAVVEFSDKIASQHPLAVALGLDPDHRGQHFLGRLAGGSFQPIRHFVHQMAAVMFPPMDCV